VRPVSARGERTPAACPRQNPDDARGGRPRWCRRTRRRARGPRLGDEPAPQPRLAEEAAVRRIGEVIGILELVCVELDHGTSQRCAPRAPRPHCRLRYRSAPAPPPPTSGRAPAPDAHDCQQAESTPPEYSDKGRRIGSHERAQAATGLGGPTWPNSSGSDCLPQRTFPRSEFESNKRIDRRPETYYPYDTSRTVTNDYF